MVGAAHSDVVLALPEDVAFPLQAEFAEPRPEFLGTETDEWLAVAKRDNGRNEDVGMYATINAVLLELDLAQGWPAAWEKGDLGYGGVRRAQVDA